MALDLLKSREREALLKKAVNHVKNDPRGLCCICKTKPVSALFFD
jgi:hypothetical protein